MWRSILGMTVTALLFLAAVIPAHAQVTLSFSPQDTTIAPAGSGRLSVMIDYPLDIRAIDLRVTFDPAILGSLEGGSGALFEDSGFNIFSGFEDSAPGEWYGYSIVIGSEYYIVGPGELFYWDYEALVEGVSPIMEVITYLAAPDGSYYAEVSVTPTTITVGDLTSSVEDLPVLRTGLHLSPNPFNPRTEIGFNLTQPGWIELSVYDLRGREVTVLHQGTAPAGPFTATWDGLDSRGLAQPGGVYLFRLATPAGPAGIKGVLLK